ncbi:MAG: DUF808 family protein [Alphaproteobacteria bacterium]|nr:MAG: DUF808 family protein [Alphaproteobacteria bacterium]
MSAGFLALMQQMAVMTQKAAVRTLGVVGDDLAVSCNQLIGGQPERKIPMVWAVVKGSMRNKAILIPCALALSFTFPAAIMPVLAAGGALLCFDSMDKLIHKKLKPPPAQVSEAYANDHAAWEKRHIKRALRTDLVLSAEITTVSLWTVAGMPFLVQLGTLVATGIGMTAAVYGVAAGIIKMDDIGAALLKTKGSNIFARAARGAGRLIGHAAPKVIKVIGHLGTAAMFLVGGGMLVHGIPGGEQLMTSALGALTTNTIAQGALAILTETAVGLVAGIAAIPVAKVVAPPLRRGYEFCAKLVNKLRHRRPEAEDDTDDVAAPAPAPLSEPAKDALQKTPGIRADLNSAANDNRSAVSAKETPKAAPPAPRPPAP